jgi:hypothetical protein
VIVTLVRFVSVPLFLHAWTTEMYGEWLILYSLLAYFSLGNLGFAQAAANATGFDAQDRPGMVRYNLEEVTA